MNATQELLAFNHVLHEKVKYFYSGANFKLYKFLLQQLLTSYRYYSKSIADLKTKQVMQNEFKFKNIEKMIYQLLKHRHWDTEINVSSNELINNSRWQTSELVGQAESAHWAGVRFPFIYKIC